MTILLFASFKSFSQTATRTEPLQKVAVVLDEETARLVIKDLISGDAAKIELSKVKPLLEKYRDESTINKALIQNLRDQNGNLQAQLSETEAMYNRANSLTRDLNKALKIEKRKSRFFTGTAIGVTVLALLAVTAQ